MSEKLNEACGLFGIYAKSPDIKPASCTYYALFSLQHRGQESCGITINDDGVMTSYKDAGLVGTVFTKEILSSLDKGQMAIGHVCYGTSVANPRANAQPLLINHIKGSMSLGHNGALTNSFKLREQLEMEGTIFHTTSDAEIISCVIIKERVNSSSIEEAISKSMDILEGAYSLVIMSPSKLIAVRDKHGFRPLCMGKIGDSIVFASESCAFDSIGAEFIRDIEPGEIVIADENGVRSDRTHCNKCDRSLCIFEYIYFARPDSVIDGVSVHDARAKAGAFLAQQNPVDADVVIGVPDSGISAAIGYAKESGIPYGVGLIKNKYIGRTFIQPDQKQREDSVRIKLSPVSATLKGKKVVLVDDSIVRGTTSAKLVNLIRQAGAVEVHARISSPPFINLCHYGTDVASRDHLIAVRHTIDEIKEKIGVDSLEYLSYENMLKICGENETRGFCSGCFTGKYATEIDENANLDKFYKKRSEK